MKENADKARGLDAAEIAKQLREGAGADVPAALPDVAWGRRTG